jgi:hypothetical protein
MSNKTVAELEAALETARAAERELTAERDRNRADAWEAVMRDPNSWEWRVLPTEYKRFMFKADSPAVKGAKIDKRLHPELVASFIKQWDHVQDDKMIEWHGCFYFRTPENILTHCGGGWMVLNDPMLCNDEEWVQIINGWIPPKYRDRSENWF